jgi:hypothetical protein
MAASDLKRTVAQWSTLQLMTLVITDLLMATYASLTGRLSTVKVTRLLKPHQGPRGPFEGGQTEI